MEIAVNRNIKLEDIESLYKKLQKVDDGKFIDVLLSSKLTYPNLGLIPLLYQFVVTWSRNKNSGKLLLTIDQFDEQILEELYENELLFPAISFVWNKNQVYDTKGEMNLRSELRKKNSEIFERMKRVKPLKGNKLLLTDFDHLPADRGLLPCFEVNNEFVKDEFILSNSLRNALSELLSYSNLAKSLFHIVFKELIGIIYELMKNTFEWARTDKDKIPLDPNMRGLLIKFLKRSRSNYLKESKEHQGFLSYFSSESFKENSKGELYFLELSVFDSGIGFVDKYKSLNPQEKYLTSIDVLKKCLVKHMTSAKGLNKDDKGVGLDRILSLLDKKGFLKIRTETLSVYRNLVTHEYKSVQEVTNMELFDWYTNKNDEYTKCEKVEGAVITILYPLSLPYIQTLPFNE